MTGQVLDFNQASKQGEHQSGERFDADRTRMAVNARAASFVEWLFPCAVIHRSGKFAAIGDIYGQPGESLHIELTGAKAGYWKDFASGEDRGKDLIGLFMASNDMHSSDFGKALELINTEFLNESRPEWTREFTQHLKQRAKKYDGMPKPVINDRPPPSEAYVYRDVVGGVIGVVRRHEYDTIDPATGKPKKTFSVWDAVASKAQAPMPRPLYRIPEIIRVNDIVFVEGERKADALASVGIEATCIMFGSDAPLDKVDWTPISGKRIRIWPDKDASGQKFADRLSPMLSALGCEVSVVNPPADKPNKWDAVDCIAEGGDPVAILRSANAVAAPAINPDTFKLYTLEELENLPPPEWLVDRVMVSNGLVLFWAGSDNYKTFVAIDLAMCVAAGVSWHGHEVKGGPVVYVAAEDETGVSMRMIGWRRTKGLELPRPDVTVLRDGFTMASPDADKLIRSIKALPAKPRLVVIDTVARTFGAGNEDKTSDMNAFVLGMDRIRRETGATVMVVHHTGRNTEQERGNVALRGACDTIFTVKKAGKSKIKLINSPPKGKQKNAEPFADIPLRLQEVAFPYLDSERTTLIVMSDESTPAAGEPLEGDEEEDTAPRLGQIEKSILVALEKAARSDRKHLGFISLHATVRGDKGNFGRSLRKLVEKRLVSEIVDETDPEKKRHNYALIKHE